MEFLNKFDLNKKYVFDKDIYIEYMLSIDAQSEDPKYEKYWTTICNNVKVTYANSKLGLIGEFSIMPEWCREVPTKIRLMNENDFK